ncbi:MAG: hypothetical protein QME75_08265 [Deltaproteobacteria bacterium]|nr:hypothetical protein [Deltaproteobacteria bacterium]
MSEGRGRKTRKSKWQLTLGVKETVFSLVGVIGLVMMSFAVGTLAGRGDIYRVLHNWGLLGPEAVKAVQPWNLPQANMSLFAPAGPPAVQQPETGPTAAAPVHPAAPVPQQGSIAGAFAPAPAGSQAAKKSKPNASSASRQKMKEEELRRLREEVAKKLKFQNSLDTSTYKSAKKGAAGSKAKTSATTLAKGKAADKKSSPAKVAELQKKGAAASDQKARAASPSKPVSTAQNKPKSGATKLKTKGE